MKKMSWLFIAVFGAVIFSGCAMIKMIKGPSEDTEVRRDADNNETSVDTPLTKADKWLRDNWW